MIGYPKFKVDHVTQPKSGKQNFEVLSLTVANMDDVSIGRSEDW